MPREAVGNMPNGKRDVNSGAEVRHPMHAPTPHARITCGAKTRAGRPCKNTAVMANGRCRMHGGKSPLGAGSATFRNGSRSKYRAIFAGDSLEHYERGREDPRYIELREEIAALDALILEELMAAKVGHGGALWEELGKVWTQFRRADPTRDTTSAGGWLRKVGEIIEEGARRHAAQREALDIVERKRRLAETERRRIVAAERMISETQAMTLVAAVVAAVRNHVTDRETLAAIHADLAKLVHAHVGARDSAGSTAESDLAGDV